MSDALYSKLNALRDEYRRKMNRLSDMATEAAGQDEMDKVSLYSTESERARAAFAAVTRAIEIVETEIAP